MSDIETAAFKEAQESLRKASTLAASTAKSSKPKASSIGEAKSTRIETIETPSGGGDGNGSGSHGGGSGGNNNHGSSGNSNSDFFKKSTLLVIATVITSLMTAYFMLWKTTDKGIASDKDNNNIRIIQANTELLKASAASGVIPAGFERVSPPQHEVLPIPVVVTTSSVSPIMIQQKEIVNVTTFGDVARGNSNEEVEQLFVSNPFLNIDGRYQSLRVEQGYTKIKLRNFSTFEGHDYVVTVAEKDVKSNGRPNYFFKCGDAPELLEIEKKRSCLWFMKQYEGFEVRFTILPGGFVKAD